MRVLSNRNSTETDTRQAALVTQNGLYEFNVFPQGLKNAPPTFQRIMNIVWRKADGDFALVYLDDILRSLSKSWEEHMSDRGRRAMNPLESQLSSQILIESMDYFTESFEN